jgi:polysaccharide export outer membrane protein
VISNPLRIKTKVLIFIGFSAIFSSCVTRKDITYFQTLDRKKIDTVNVDRKTNDEVSKLRTAKFEARIQPGDLLNISISSLNPEASSLFTFQSAGKTGAFDPSANIQAPGFLVDQEGNIQFPVLGNISAKGKTIIEVRKEIETKLQKYLESPVVSVRYSNFKITIMGDVAKPGVYTFPSERVTLFEAISTAGDMTIFGNRREVKLVREVDGKNEVTILDFTDKDLLKTQMMYLQPNDIIYVEPGKGKIASADNTYRILPIILTGLNTLALIIWRTTLITK